MKKWLRLLEETDGALPERAAFIVHGGTVMALLSGFGGGDYFDYSCGCGEGYQCVLHWRTEDLRSVRITDIRKLNG